jgi:hypothetical protein
MKRNAFDETREHLDKEAESQHRCRRCTASTAWQELSDHGGRCYACFQAFCRSPFDQHEPSAYARSVRAMNAGQRS